MRLRDGYTLIVAIMIVFIVMFLVASWITYIQNRSRRIIYLEDKMQAFYNAESGLAKAIWHLSGKGNLNFASERSGIRTCVDTLFDNKKGTAEITIRDRGFFTEIVSKGKEGKYTETVKALVGSSSKEMFSNACYILSPGVLHIKGHVEGNIETRGTVIGNINGEVIQNPSLLFPAIGYNSVSSRMAQYRNLIENPAQADTEIFSPLIIDEENDLPNKSLIYVNDVVLIESDDYLNPLIIEGNSVIVSPDEIQISGNAKLRGIDFISYGRILVAGDCSVKDAILYSENEIEIRENAQFEGTILTKGSIKLCENATLSNNSVLVSNSDRFIIKLSNRANFNGTIVLCPKVGLGKTVTSYILIEEDVKIKGLIFSTTGVRLKGTLTGTVYAPTFIGEPVPPDSQNMNVLEGEIVIMKEKDYILPQIFTGMTKKVFSWEKE